MTPAATRSLASLREPLLAIIVVGLVTSISLTQVALTALAVWVVLARRGGILGPLRMPLQAPILAYAGWSIVAALSSANPGESLQAAKSLLNLGTLWVLASALEDAARACRFATWLFWAAAVVAALSIVQVAGCPWSEGYAFTPLVERFFGKCGRAHGFYSIYMTLAGVLVPVLVSALPWLARFDGRSRWGWPAWLVQLTALALTAVRGAWIGFAAGAVTALVMLGRRRIVVGAAVLAAGLALAMLPPVASRLSTIGDVRDDTTRDRIAMLDAGVRIVKSRPLTGIGPGQLKHVYGEMAGPEALRRSTSHLHNAPLQIMAERGAVGLVLWLWLFVAFFVRASLLLRHLPANTPSRAIITGALPGVAAFLVAGLFEYNFGDSEVLLVVLSLMALPFASAPPEES